MEGLRLKIKKRAFPSHGRVRLHESCLTDLKIVDGDYVDLINETMDKTVTVTVIADRMVGEGEIRVSEEDLKSLDLKDGNEVTIKKTLALKDKIKKAAGEANTSFSAGVKQLDERLRKTASEVKASAAKTADTVKTGAVKTSDTVKTEAKKAADKAGKIAGETSETVKKGLKGKDEL
jgi:predicted DNA-binding antitoxin AbrB/MazE fold protein